MKAKKIFGMITMLAVLLSFCSTTFVAYGYEEYVSSSANNVSQIIGDGNTVVFIDVPSNYWAKNQIDYFAQQGIIDGYTDGSFQPEAGVTREEFCKLLVSTFKQPLETPTTPTFADVAENRWSYPYVEVCREFLTGYANPFGGLPAFHPEEYATREDIAVALVRMMGFTDSDANDKNYAKKKFSDGSSISPSLMPYVSIACERGLISGYPNGNFGPTQGITRAETVVLLNRATKQAVTNINADLQISANVLYSEDGKTATINIVAEEGTTVTINGETVKMSSNYYDEYEGNYVYKFEQEGTKDFVIEGKHAGKTKTVNVTAKYEIDAPVLTVSQSNQTVTNKEFTLSGKASDANYDVSVTVNGESVNVNYYNEWSKSYILSEGENTFEVVATNENGKQTKKSITVTYTVGAPVLTVNQSNQTVTDKKFTLSGKASDANYDVSVTVNGESVNVNYYKEWSKSYILSEGENTFEVVATNENGKQTKKSITVTYTVGAPVLTVNQSNQTVTDKKFTLSGKASDANYDVSVTINGESVNVNYYKEWSRSYILSEGENTFEVVATNENGKQTKKNITVTYTVGAPELTINQSSQTVTDKKFTLSGKASDANYDVSVTVNGESVNVNYYKEWSKSYILSEGENTFEVIATNENGKQTKDSITITFKVGNPEIKFINCPENTKKNRITIKGKITGNNEGAMLFIDDEEVYVNYSGEFSETVELKEGSNTFEFRAVNDYGKEVTVTKKITYTPEVEDDTDETTEN